MKMRRVLTGILAIVMLLTSGNCVWAKEINTTEAVRNEGVVSNAENEKKEAPLVGNTNSSYPPSYNNDEMVDNNAVNITMNLFDYTANENINACNENYGINSGHALLFGQFDNNYYKRNGFAQNWNYGNRQASIVKSTLTDGYPVLADDILAYGKSNDIQDNGSLKYLFDPNYTISTNVRETYKNVNRLLRKDNDGYYEYNSGRRGWGGDDEPGNYAFYDKSQGDNGNFKVYKKTNKKGIGFFPFKDYDADYEGTYGWSGLSYRIYDEALDHFFGMAMETNFLMPKNGKLPNGQDMIFEFSGDDDCWVFIDGVLVLDMSVGLKTGRVNFNTGKVYVSKWNGKRMVSSVDSNISNIFQSAGKVWDNTPYQTHSLKMFYLERGGAYSNLKVRFNTPTVPQGTIQVGKDLSNTDKEKYANTEFAYQVFVKKNNAFSPIELNNANIIYTNNENQPIQGQEVKKNNNIFYLKPGQRVQISGLNDNDVYKVREIGVRSDEYDEVKVNGTEIHVVSDAGEESTEGKDIETTEAPVYSRPAVRFTNNVTGSNKHALWIEKKLEPGIEDENTTFSFQIQFRNTEGNFEDYVGQYYIVKPDSVGMLQYYTIVAGQLTAQNSKTAAGMVNTADNGVISGIPAGYDIVIEGLLSGTEFKVDEVNIPSTYLTNYEKKLTESSKFKSDVETIDKGVDGKIKKGWDSQIIITNHPSSYPLTVKKIVSGNSTGIEPKNGEYDIVIKFPGADEKFPKTLSIKKERGEETSVPVADDTISIGIKSSEDVEIIGIPVGSEYEITEKYYPGFMVQYSKSCKGKLVTGTIATVKNTVLSRGESYSTPRTPQLNTYDHYAYVIGYPDKSVHPSGEITRAETAAIFFRLLTSSVRDSEFAKIKQADQTAVYDDVKKGSWYYSSVAVMKDLGIIYGYPDGSFRPNAPITRAEFAAIAERFNKNPSGEEITYSDIAGLWAEKDIKHAAADGWIYGYPDGTFRPNNKITRAEAMAIVNRVLRRYPDASYVFGLQNDPELNVWTDNSDRNKWYYLDVQEATNSHKYHKTGTARVTNERKYGYNTEWWDDVTKAPDWTRYNL